MSEMKRIFLTAVVGLAMTHPAVAQWNAEDEPADGDEKEWGSAAEFDRYRIGGYGEVLANFMSYGPWRNTNSGGSSDKGRNQISLPRFVLAGDLHFDRKKKWTLGVEIEFEAGGTGTAREIEWDDENGEYETELEKGGEVALEQLHITREIFPELGVRVGHMVLPVGQINAHHEPTNYLGTSRPEAETIFIPSTWHETGIEIFGKALDGILSYQAFVVTGLNADGFRRSDWIKKGKQGLFETDNFTSPAYVARIDVAPVRGLRFGGSVYYCNNAGANADKVQKYSGFKTPVVVASADAQYKGYGVVARANFLYGRIGNADRLINEAHRTVAKQSGYTTDNFGKQVHSAAMSWGMEAGWDISYAARGMRGKALSALIPFVRYEWYDPCYEAAPGKAKFDQFEVSKWTAGINYYPLKELVIKADYTWRRVGQGKYNNENEFSLCVGYSGWFFSDRSIKAYHARRAEKKLSADKEVIAKMNQRLEMQQREIDALKAKIQ